MTTKAKADRQQLADLTVAQLRDKARELGLSGVSHMHKDDLVEAVADAMRTKKGAPKPRGSRESGAGARKGGGGGVRKGKASSKSLEYSQEVTSTEDEPEREGRSLATTSHDVIRQWAEERGATPATVEGTEHGDHLGVLRFDFPGYGGEKLRHVEWDEWFATFDQRGLNFIYQEKRSDGSQSNFFQLENPDREDA